MRKILAYPFVSSLVFVFLSWMSLPYIVFKFEEGVQGSNITSYTDSLWYGIVTMLTVGYGDRYPITPLGRVVGSLLMVFGVIGIGIVTAKISSYFLEKALRDRRGFVDTNVLKNHFIVCGWKQDMPSLLMHILESNPSISAEDIVLVNNVSDSDIENLHEIGLLKLIKVIKGDFFVVEVLKRAAPEKARKILLLADGTPDSKGAIPTRSEADARTIMTAMTINNIAKGVPVVAEIIDSSMDQYLKLAHVNEIIYSRDYSRLLLAMASTGTGLTNIFHDLLAPQSLFSLSTEIVPAELIQQNFAKLKEHFQKTNPNDTIIGVLENSGNSHIAKEMALRKAQQTPNVKKLVENLNQVKSLRFNQPIFNPKDDYIVSEGAMVIFIKSKQQVGVEAHA